MARPYATAHPRSASPYTTLHKVRDIISAEGYGCKDMIMRMEVASIMMCSHKKVFLCLLMFVLLPCCTACDAAPSYLTIEDYVIERREKIGKDEYSEYTVLTVKDINGGVIYEDRQYGPTWTRFLNGDTVAVWYSTGTALHYANYINIVTGQESGFYFNPVLAEDGIVVTIEEGEAEGVFNAVIYDMFLGNESTPLFVYGFDAPPPTGMEPALVVTNISYSHGRVLLTHYVDDELEYEKTEYISVL